VVSVPLTPEEAMAKVELPELDEGMQAQLDRYVAAIRITDERRAERRADVARETAMLAFKFARFITSRNQRVTDLHSAELLESMRIKNKLFPYGAPKLVLCVDGRVLPKFFAGMHGNALRVAAAEITEFVASKKDGHLVLPANSPFGRMVLRAIDNGQVVTEVLDSHIGCAARGRAEEETTGVKPADGGLRKDVIRQRQKARSLVEFAQEHQGTIIPIQTSFDPHSGYMYMGLEKEECLTDSAESGYTADKLRKLVRDNKIIWTQQLLDEGLGIVRRIFEENGFDIDYLTDYRQSSLSFWRGMEAMCNNGHTILDLIEAKLKAVYPRLSQHEHQKELRQRAVLLLANTYNAFLHNQRGHYPYGEHDESVIVVTRSEKGPFESARPFSVYSEAPNLSENVLLTQRLVRGNRRAGRLSEVEKTRAHELYPDAEQYAEAAVPLVTFERLASIPADLPTIQNTDWTDLLDTDWQNMSDEEFLIYLQGKIPNISLASADTLNRLRHRAIKLVQPGAPATELVLNGGIVPLWTVAGPDREILALIPFLAVGSHS
jgi:hypothetical protein